MKTLIQYVVFSAVVAAVLVACARGNGNAQRQSASSEPCGGPPSYCATTSRGIIQETPMNPPAVNTPFRDPDFGSRMVRVTDANTRAEYGHGYFVGTSYGTDSSGEANEWSVFDPRIGSKGGYRFYIYDRGANLIPFAFDPTTMHVTRIVGRQEELNGTGGIRLHGPSFSYKNPDVLYGSDGPLLVAYHFSTDRMTPVYDFDKCPGLPGYISKPYLYMGGVTNSGDDTKFSYYFGGSAQNGTTFVTYYDRTANHGAGACYWYDTITGMAGGTNMPPTRVTGDAGQIAPPPAPRVTAHPGAGSLPAGKYYVKLTAMSRANPQNGETTPSAEVGPVELKATGSLTVAFPSRVSASPMVMMGRPAFRVYIGTSPGGERLQGAADGSEYTQRAPLNLAAAAPPAINTAGFNVHNARMSKDGTVVRVNAPNDRFAFWKAGTNQVIDQIPDFTGHQAMGYTHLINDPNNHDMAEVLIRPLANPGSMRLLVDPLPSPRQFNDSHWSWSDADPGDTTPVCGTFYNSHADGNGTLSATTNPVLQITAPYDREIVCVATTGPSRVWRFAHHRGTSAANARAGSGSNWYAVTIGNVSQDGRFYLFGSDWDWSLGSEAGSPGCPYAGRCRSDVFIVELH
ncbi:MAG: hypothetical protein ACRD1N_04860 [Terriglobia bacterium]